MMELISVHFGWLRWCLNFQDTLPIKLLFQAQKISISRGHNCTLSNFEYLMLIHLVSEQLIETDAKWI